MPDDILSAIDRAVGCQQCGGPLGESVSDDFCTQDCQAAWHATDAETLTSYREPWDTWADGEPYGQVEHRYRFHLPPGRAYADAVRLVAESMPPIPHLRSDHTPGFALDISAPNQRFSGLTTPEEARRRAEAMLGSLPIIESPSLPDGAVLAVGRRLDGSIRMSALPRVGVDYGANPPTVMWTIQHSQEWQTIAVSEPVEDEGEDE